MNHLLAMATLGSLSLSGTLLAAPPSASPEAPSAPSAPAPAILAPAPATSAAPTPTAAGGVFVGTPEVIAEGFQFVEGPTWIPAGQAAPGFLIFCEYPSKTVYRVPGVVSKNEAAAGKKPGPYSVFRADSGGAIGSAVDGHWSVYFAEAGTRSITRIDMTAAGWSKPTTLVSAWDKQPLNDTNDLVVSKNGTLYFTDPTFFNRGQWKQPHKGLYRIAPDGKVTLECADLKLPNGLALTPDEKTLYVNEFGAQKVLAFAVKDDGTLGERREFADLKAFKKGTRGGADGLKVDAQGRVFTTGPGGIYCLSPAGELLDFLALPGSSNVAIGGEDGTTLFITAGGRVLKVGMR